MYKSLCIMGNRGFASDNNAGVLPEVMQAIADANSGHAIAYGGDEYTREAEAALRRVFGEATQCFFVFNGTGANVVALQAMARSYEGVVCAATAHINVDECGAPEKLSGCKLIDVPTPDGKLSPELIAPVLHGFGFEHHVQPRVLSLTQASEMGTLYSIEELRALCAYAHERGLLVHMDGARLSNAAAALNCSLANISVKVGVDVLSLGATKNGLMFGEAVLVFNPELQGPLKYIRKQSTQLFSKMRFLSAQYTAFLKNELWRKSARHANQMAQLLAREVGAIKEVQLTQKVESNAVFALIPKEWIAPLQAAYFFYVWDENRSEVRWMTSFDTTEADIHEFVAQMRRIAELKG